MYSLGEVEFGLFTSGQRRVGAKKNQGFQCGSFVKVEMKDYGG